MNDLDTIKVRFEQATLHALDNIANLAQCDVNTVINVLLAAKLQSEPAPVSMKCAHDLPPDQRTIIPPEGGWKPSTYYIVEVAFNRNNPIHRSIFYSGFLNNGSPAGYNSIWNPSYDEQHDIDTVHYMKAIKEVAAS